MPLTPFESYCPQCGRLVKATELCCWVMPIDKVGNHTVKGNEDTEEGNGNNYKKSDS